MASNEYVAGRECERESGELNTAFTTLVNNEMAEKVRHHCDHYHISIASYIRSLIENDLSVKSEVDRAYIKQMNYYNRLHRQEDDGK